jgi:hypothetical protein
LSIKQKKDIDWLCDELGLVNFQHGIFSTGHIGESKERRSILGEKVTQMKHKGQ